ncbi:MAG: exopolygalacturonase [Bacteroidetes bacterium GWD2_45_23]|nr:MAG: exopolygalacturonase [Bacteroidetes bacterium GWC2_46_850]OFX72596.1 MAG: exopolygalacturonase [Bacteroidetes bacterium GWC1_47_7]OFX87564.1 MAG: exopolygalacturonase [Bacteroidetes bacterium GWD2_45_23]HAR37947.1 exopolygalacturonase [Porphyromonadaceae bacterium]HBB01484.1 exopolygalacturonase [Porphyromonadaceae bacterium]
MKTNKKIILLVLATLLTFPFFGKEFFPDGTPIPDWFRIHEKVDINQLGKLYKITDYGVVNDSTLLQTEQIQAVIDRAYANGGGVVFVPQGVYLSGALFFKQNTHLYLERDAVLKGSDDISNYPVLPTRIEGQSIDYFAAFINADGLDGFTITGEGTINGNGLRYWKSFWLRRRVNPKCTNLDEMRPRLVFISNSKNVHLTGVSLINSPFWTTHLYKCENVRLSNLTIFAPREPVKAPSSDAVDIDVCKNVHITRCSISVNDDAIALKGGKGPLADKDDNNGGNSNVIIEDCNFGFCHGVLTCGSESIHNRNIVVRRLQVDQAVRLLWLKMRPDTPQNYEYILVEDITGNASSFLYIKPWTQFFDLQGQTKMPLSYGSHVTLRNITLECNTFFDVNESDQYVLSDFTLENLHITAQKDDIPQGFIRNLKLKNITINGQKRF